MIDAVGEFFRLGTGAAVALPERLQADGAVLGLPAQGVLQTVAEGVDFTPALLDAFGRMGQAGG